MSSCSQTGHADWSCPIGRCGHSFSSSTTTGKHAPKSLPEARAHETVDGEGDQSAEQRQKVKQLAQILVDLCVEGVRDAQDARKHRDDRAGQFAGKSHRQDDGEQLRVALRLFVVLDRISTVTEICRVFTGNDRLESGGGKKLGELGQEN